MRCLCLYACVLSRHDAGSTYYKVTDTQQNTSRAVTAHGTDRPDKSPQPWMTSPRRDTASHASSLVPRYAPTIRT